MRKLDWQVPAIRYMLPWPPSGLPRALWIRVRRLRILVYIQLAVYLAAGAVIIRAWLTGVQSRGADLVAVLVIFPPILLVAFRRALARSLERFACHLRESEYQHCLNCGYCLQGLPDEHQCPECGEEYDIAAVRGKWQEWLST